MNNRPGCLHVSKFILKKKNKKILVLFPFNMGKRVSFHGKFNENIIYFSHILYKILQQFCCNNLSIFCLF